MQIKSFNIKSKNNPNQFDKSIFYSSNISDMSLVHFQALIMKTLSYKYKYYNKWIATSDNDNVQSHDQGEESKLNSIVNVISDAHKPTQD